MEEWKEYKFTEIATLIGGGTPKTSNPSYWGGDIPWLSVKDFGNDDKYVYETEKTITEEGLNNSSTKLLQKDDIIISARGTIGELAMIPFPMSFNQSCFGIRGKENVDKHFLYYFTKTKINNLKSSSHGSVFDTITRATFDNIICLLPSLPTQQKIANILSSLDDKIEVNRRINEQLEEMAQALFKSWFVDFEPFKEQPFVETELGMIPEGWKVYQLTDLVKLIGGYSYKGNELTTSEVAMATIKNFERKGGFKIDGYKEIIPSEKLKESQIVKLHDIIVAHTDLTQNADIIGNPAMIMSLGGYKKLIISMDLVKVESINKDISNGFLYCLLKDKRFKEHALGYVNGTTVLHLSKKALPDYKIALPNDLNRLNEIGKTLDDIFLKEANNYSEIEYLTTLRDTLLPKLMSGEIAVDEVE